MLVIWLSKTKLQKSDEIFLWFMCDLNIYYAGDFVQSYHWIQYKTKKSLPQYGFSLKI